MWRAALCALSLAADHRPHQHIRGRRHDDDVDLQHLSEATEGDDSELLDQEQDEEPDAYPDDERPESFEGQQFQSLQEQVAKLSARLDAGQDTKRIDALETQVGELETELAEEKAEQARTENSVLAAVSRNLKPIVHKLVVSVAHVVSREKVLEENVKAQAQPKQADEAASESVPQLSKKVEEVLKPELERVLEGDLETDVRKALKHELDTEVQSLGNASGPVVEQLNFAAQLAGVVERNVEQNVSARLRFVRKGRGPAPAKHAAPERDEAREARALAAASEALKAAAPDRITVAPEPASEAVPQAPRAEPAPQALAEASALAAPAPVEAEETRGQAGGFSADRLLSRVALLRTKQSQSHARPKAFSFEQVSATTRSSRDPTPAEIQAALDATEIAPDAPDSAETPEGLASLIKAAVAPKPEPQPELPQEAPQEEQAPAPAPKVALVEQPKAPEKQLSTAESKSDFSGVFCSMCGQRCPYAICHGA